MAAQLNVFMGFFANFASFASFAVKLFANEPFNRKGRKDAKENFHC